MHGFKKKKVLCFFAGLLFFLCANVSQASTIATISSSIIWQTSIGGTSDDRANSLQLTPDGGCIIAGVTNSRDGDIKDSHGRKDAFVAKLDASGKVEWKKSYGGSETDIAYSIGLTNDGGYIVTGSTDSPNGDVSNLHGCNDMWVFKLGSDGSIQWQKCLGGTRDDCGASIQQTSDGGYIVSGMSNSIDGDIASFTRNETAWVVKLNGTGAIQWQAWLGNIGDNFAYCVKQTNDGSFIIAGSTNKPGHFSGVPDIGDIMVAKLASDGTQIWENEFGATGEDVAYSIQQTSDGGYILAGSTETLGGKSSSNLGAKDVWVIKLNAAGESQWQKFLGGWADDVAYNIRQTSDGGYILIGQTCSFQGDVAGMHNRSDVWLVKLDTTGNLQWQKTLGGRETDVGYDVQETPDGFFIFTGGASSMGAGDIIPSHPGTDIWVVKVKP